jgi:twitching motility two-component system response regulator PilH
MPTVLIVDDVATDRALLGKVVSEAGYQTLFAADGKEGLAMAKKHLPALIFLDVVMPDLNGFNVCRDLKKSPDTSKIPIVLVTSKNEETDRFWGKKQGADEHVGKPYTKETIVGVLRRLVG